MAIAALFCYGYFITFSQVTGLNSQYYFNSISSPFETVMPYNEGIVIVGQYGVDSTGLSSFFTLEIDTFGTIHGLDFYYDPELTDHALVNAYGYDAAIKTPDNGVLIAGSMLYRNSLFLLKLDSVLQLQFFKEYPSSFITRHTAHLLHFNNSYYALGTVQKIDKDVDVFVHKIDLEGNQIWDKTYGHPEYWNNGGSVVIENGGLTIIYGEWYDPNRFLPNDTRRWTNLMHIDTSGQVLWQWKSEENEEGGSPTSFLVNNSLYYYTTRPGYQPDNYDVWLGTQIVCRDSLLNLVWRKDYSEIFSFFNGFLDMTLGPDGYLYTTGQIADGVLWARICKIDPVDGDIIWEARDTGIWRQGFGSRNQMEGITVLPGGSVIAVGSTYDPATGHEHGLLLKVTKDGCIDTLCTTSMIDDYLSKKAKPIHIYPNPAIDYILVELSDELPDSYVQIFDMHGHRIRSEAITRGINIVPLGDQPPGMFMWRVISEKGRLVDSGKIIVSR